jgi:hypothetical protein
MSPKKAGGMRRSFPCHQALLAERRLMERRNRVASRRGVERTRRSGQVVAKGQYILVEGQLRSHEYEKPVKAGRSSVAVKVRVWEIRASSIRKLVPKEKAEAAA